MNTLRKKVYFGAGFTTVFHGSGRPEFHPDKPRLGFEELLRDTARGTMGQLANPELDEGVITNFMAERFVRQGNLPGFLPMAVPSLLGKPCTRLEGACGSGGLGLVSAVKSILSDLADSVYVTGFEVQNTLKAVYGADVLAGAGYYRGDRKSGHAYFFPGVFSDRAGAYSAKYGQEYSRRGMAKWYEMSILHARKNPNAQEFHNKHADLFALGMTTPNATRFVAHLNLFDCSKVTDGAASLIVASETGLKKLGLKKSDMVELVAYDGSEGDITQKPVDLTWMENTANASNKAFSNAKLKQSDIGVLELHDCFSISGLLALESMGFTLKGSAPNFVLEGNTKSTGVLPTNLSGGLCGFGHPVGGTGIRQMVDLWMQLTGKAPNPASLKKEMGMMVSMGGNDKTVTALIVKQAE